MLLRRNIGHSSSLSWSSVSFILWISLVAVLHCIVNNAEAGRTTSVLITGGAGFLGYHSSLDLIENGRSVIVLDNFDSQAVDQLLRNQRAAELQKKGAKVYHGDICDTNLLKHFINNVSVSAIVHLAGDTRDDIDMEIYAKEHLQCFVGLLEVLREYKSIPLVYVSSSSVSIQRSVQTVTGQSVTVSSSMYSAMKSSEELFAQVYCQKYGFVAIGLRPFNPYGPWGEPRSLLYDLASNIWNKAKIEVSQNSVDITYVSDIAKGIRLALTSEAPCGQVYELGRGEGTPIATVLKHLEAGLGRKASWESGKVSTGTHVADIKTAQRAFSYTPTVSVEKGIELFTSWFRDYHENKHSGSFSVDRSLSQEIRSNTIKEKSQKFIKRMQDIREKYERESTEPVAKFYKNREFIFFPNVDSGRDDIYHRGKSIDELKKICGSIDECVAFSTNGGLKSHIDPKSSWKKIKNGGLYVADINVCLAGLHNCYGNSTCKHLGPSQFECGCNKGFSMKKKNVCSQTEYVEGLMSDIEESNRYSDVLSGHPWNGKPTDTFTEHKGKMIEGSTIFGYPDAKGDVEKLKAACLHTYHCVGFNTHDNQLRIKVDSLLPASDSSSSAFVRDTK